LAQGLALLTNIRKTRKHRVMRLRDTRLLRKRARIETSNDQFKTISQMEHTRHRGVTGFLGHLVAGLVAYTSRSAEQTFAGSQG
jgi:hypothetical protein